MTETTTRPATDDQPPTRGSFPNAWTLLSVRGIPLRIDRSFLLIAAIVAYLFYDQLGRLLEGPLVTVAAAVVATAAFFASVLAHELGHALTSLARGIPVSSITLFAMGGVTETTREARSARDEFVVVGIGPFVSLVLGAAFGLLATAAAAVPPVAVVAGYLGWANVALAVFNVVPAYPLDGGRLLRSLIWGVTRRPHQATRWAARVGQVFAVLLIGLGLVALAVGPGGFGGLWEVLIGIFLLRGATDSRRRAGARERLANRRVRDVMGSAPPALSPDLTLAAAIERVQQRPSLPWPVADPDGPVTGVVRLTDIDAVASTDWSSTRVQDIATSADGFVIGPDERMDVTLDRLAETPGSQLLVVEAGRLLGIVSPSLVSDLI